MNTLKFQELFAAAAEECGVAAKAREHKFADLLQKMMIELDNKIQSLPTDGLKSKIEPPSFEEAQGEYNSYHVALNG